MTWLGSMEKNDVHSLIDGQNISVKHNINRIVVLTRKAGYYLRKNSNFSFFMVSRN